jgi:hypothetical protein
MPCDIFVDKLMIISCKEVCKTHLMNKCLVEEVVVIDLPSIFLPEYQLAAQVTEAFPILCPDVPTIHDYCVFLLFDLRKSQTFLPWINQYSKRLSGSKKTLQ